MRVRTEFAEKHATRFLESPATRTGLGAGAGLAIVFTLWIFLANRTTFTGHAVARNIVTATILGVLAAIPVLRFPGRPRRLLVSGTVAWGIFSLTYWAMCILFTALSDRYSAFQIFVLGMVVYLIASTLCWIGSVVLRVRAHDVARCAGRAPGGGNSQRHPI